jgi:hypothetical protein
MKTCYIRFALLLVLMALVVLKAAPAYAATSPGLGAAASFAVLAGTAVTNVPTSVITGDVGLSPAAGSNYSGLTAAEVSGSIYAVDNSGPGGSLNYPSLLTAAKTDLTTAYNALALGANADANCTAGWLFGTGDKDLSGASLSPGVYCAANFTLTGTLNLTGTGVWVFRSAGTLITSGTANVVGGNPCDIWWQVPSSATLGAGSLKGNVLALTSIGMTTGVTLNGRVLASTGAVTLQSNTINQSCTASIPKAGASTYTSTSTSYNKGPCIDDQITNTPIIIESRRVDADSIFISWGPYTGTDTFNVRYGVENGKWLYNTNVTGFSTTINALPVNQPIWIEVAERNNCSTGPYSIPRLVGGPGLPNTGFAPRGNTIPWYTPWYLHRDFNSSCFN